MMKQYNRIQRDTVKAIQFDGSRQSFAEER